MPMRCSSGRFQSRGRASAERQIEVLTRSAQRQLVCVVLPRLRRHPRQESQLDGLAAFTSLTAGVAIDPTATPKLEIGLLISATCCR
jgi:hypothetical protein